jgi:iron complex transport system substrate-binding protein
MLAVILAVLAGVGSAASAAPPKRIVSINVCADQLVQMLAPREDVAALSFLAGDPQMSVMAHESDGYRLIRGQAEEVLPLEADLVVAGVYSTPATVTLLRRLGERIEILPMTSNLAGIRDNVRLVAGWLGREARGNRILADFDARLADVAMPQGARRPTAIVYYVNSLAAGRGTLADAVLEAAGYANLAAQQGIDGEGYLPLERIIANPPDLIVLGNGALHYRSITADNLRHPALNRLMQRVPHVVLPQALLMCDTPRIVEAIEILAAARTKLIQSMSSGAAP